MSEKLSDLSIKDPLSELSRKERKSLLLTSIIGIIISKAGLIPTKINALGIEFKETDQNILLLIVISLILYFLIAFIMYSSSDFLAWRLSFLDVIKDKTIRMILEDIERKSTQGTMVNITERDKQKAESIASDELLRKHKIIFSLIKPTSFIRAIFEFIIPIVIGIFSIIFVGQTINF